MFSKLFTGLVIIGIACCLYGYTTLQVYDKDPQEISETQAPLIPSEEPSDQVPSRTTEKDKAKFLQFIYQLSQLAFISSRDTNLWQEARQYFPQTEQFENHDLNLQYISSNHGTHLILYEFRQEEKTDKGSMFLANFSDSGNLINQLKLKAISYDGTLSINVVGTDIIEVEYIDFLVKNHFQHSDNYTEKQGKNSKLGYHPIPELEVLLKKQYIEQTDFEYYKIDSHQQFQQLSKNNTTQENRNYPQTASRIISKEELRLMKESELELMRHEIYASYGLDFTDKTGSDSFSEMDWHTAQHENIDTMLSDVERINMEHISAVSKTDYSFLNR